MFLSQSFTILRNIILDLHFYIFVMFFCVFYGEITKVGKENLLECTLGWWVKCQLLNHM